MLRNLLLTLVVVLCLTTTAHTREPNSYAVDMTEQEWSAMFQDIGYMARWINARNMHETYASSLRNFLEKTLDEMVFAVESGYLSEEKAIRIG